MKKLFSLLLFTVSVIPGFSQTPKDPASLVNVFLGTSGDHGQLSPAASYPFSTMSIGPQTYPHTHTGYEYNAKKFLGFTHGRMEGVGCTGSGGNIMITPFSQKDTNALLLKTSEQGHPGYYGVGFGNGISAEMVVEKSTGMHHYRFPDGGAGFRIDLSHTLSNRFEGETHTIDGNEIYGWVESGTTCNAGKYRLYYSLKFSTPVEWKETGEHHLTALLPHKEKEVYVTISFSSVDVSYARKAVPQKDFNAMKKASRDEWNRLLGAVQVKGDEEREKLFYSLLYRTIQSPYVISEDDGAFRGNDGSLQKANDPRYNGWAIWDNYRTQLPLISIAWPEQFGNMAASISNLYRYGKKDYATRSEPSNTVRTEHAVVVLLDALRKGYKVNLQSIADSIIKEVDHLDYSRPDKALESSYDAWALSEILDSLGRKEEATRFRKKALEYKTYWNKDFKDITRNDANRMQARGLYQGTIWQYRWFVPFDVKGLKELAGGEEAFLSQLNTFFENDYYNHANEPDIQVPAMYNATAQPWESQRLIHAYAVDTVVQYYFNDNSRGIDPFVNVIYKNEPRAFIRTMDDDAGALSAWYVFAATGLTPACVGWPVYYLNVPLLPEISFAGSGKKPFRISVKNFGEHRKYIASMELNGKPLKRNYITHAEIMAGGDLVITASDLPEKDAVQEVWVSEVE